MKELVEEIAKVLVDYPDAVDVRQVDGNGVTLLELRTHPDDTGRLSGERAEQRKRSVSC